MDDIIKIRLGDWQYNAGVVGLCNILDHAGYDILKYTKEYKKANGEDEKLYNEICFPLEYLHDFSKNYFDYLIYTYMNQISYYRIIKFKKNLYEIISMEIDDENYIREKIDQLNRYIKDDLHKNIKSNSYKAAFELIENSSDVVNKALNIKQIKIGKKESLTKEKLLEVKDISRQLIDIIEKFEEENYRMYIGGKNVIYNIINKNIANISILNPQVKEKDIYREVTNYFVSPVYEYINLDKKKLKYNCFNCDNPIKSFDNIALSFLNNTGFDINRKTSNVWEFQNNTGICEVCRMVYFCAPAGFTYAGDKGIFINSNTNIENLIRTNNEIRSLIITNIKHETKAMIYKSLINRINHSNVDNIKYELADVQVVTYENNKYKFMLLNESIMNVIYDANNEFAILGSGALIEDSGRYIYLYEEVFNNIANNQNLFLFIHKLLYNHIFNNEKCRYNTNQINAVMNVNVRYLKGVSNMEIDKNAIANARRYGIKIKNKYSDGNEKKIDGLSHGMLNALKTSNTDAFMDMLIRCHMYVGEDIPKLFIECLEKEEKFKVIGYAFVMGLNSVEFKKNDME